MSFLENLEEYMFPEQAGNEEIIQPELPLEVEERLSKEAIKKYNERLRIYGGTMDNLFYI